MHTHRLCPVWVGWLLASPVRNWIEPPERVIGPYVREGMKVLDIGCAMGFYTLPAARMVGPAGRVVAVDLQAGMLAGLRRRAARGGLLGRLEARLCEQGSLRLEDLREQIDFALASAVVHEVADRPGFFREIERALKPGALLLVLEPRGRVAAAEFEQSVSLARENGFEERGRPVIRRRRSALLARRPAEPGSAGLAGGGA